MFNFAKKSFWKQSKLAVFSTDFPLILVDEQKNFYKSLAMGIICLTQHTNFYLEVPWRLVKEVYLNLGFRKHLSYLLK